MDGSAVIDREEDVEAPLCTQNKFGIVLVPEDELMGAGVRLKFTRRDVKEIARLEGEVGIAGPDDAP